MRAIMNISLPEPMADIVKQAVNTGKYATKSEFFRSLIRDWSDRKLAEELSKERRKMRAGKGKLLKSLSDLN